MYKKQRYTFCTKGLNNQNLTEQVVKIMLPWKHQMPYQIVSGYILGKNHKIG